ncbi:helix-turn-helix transcriptional regulator [Dysgonomonas sp. BGC7]|nr:helix-turn-helix transcriptional regulator [Dysgonomonas sp. BGC7]
MELLYPHEHLSCYNYEKGARPTIEKIMLGKRQRWDISALENKALFMMDGTLSFSLGNSIDEKLYKGKILLLTAGSALSGQADSDSTIMIIRLHNTKQLCDCFSLDMLLREEKNNMIKSGICYLDINERTNDFLLFLDTCISDGLKCTYFFALKVKEFLYLLRAYYTKTELLGFFYPLLSKDISFSDFIMKNYHKAKSVQELADMTHYSLSGFQKRFKKVFGISAYHWMRDARAKLIYHQLNSTEKSFKEISDEYGFSSPSHFNDFCKTTFGTTPGRIRNKKELSKS